MHSHVTAAAQARSRLTAVLVLSLVVLVIEVAGAIASNSLALLADAGHLLTDVSGIGLSLLAIWFAQRSPTSERTFGYLRLEIFAAVANAVLLLGVAVFILFEAWQRLSAPPAVTPGLMLGVALIGLAANGLSLVLLRDAQRTSLTVRGAYIEVMGDFAGSIAVSAHRLSAQEIAEKEFPKPSATLKDGLKSARAIRPMADGRVLVYDEQAKKIVLADLASGKVETRMSAGTEEGEFSAPGPLLAWAADSTASYDSGKSRLMIFGPDGALARIGRFGPQMPPSSSAPPGPPGPPGAGPRGPRIANIRALIGTDLVIGTGFPAPRAPAPPGPSAPPVRIPYPVMRLSLRTMRPDTVVTLMPAQEPRAPMTLTSTGTFQVFVGTAPVQSVDAWAVMSDGTVAVVRAASYRVEWFPLVGDHIFTDAVPYTPIPITKEDKKRVVEAFKPVGEKALEKLPSRTSILAVTYEEPTAWPATHPPFRGDIPAQVDPQDRIWLATRCAKDDQSNCYDVIGRNGARVERYKLPPKTRVVGFGPGVVYTAFEQKSDKDVLQRHPLE